MADTQHTSHPGLACDPAGAIVSTSAPSGYAKGVFWNVPGKARWAMVTDATAETGSEVGGKLELRYFFDTGVQKGVALSGLRTTGLLTVRADPAEALGIATKQYVDARVVNSSSGSETTSAMSTSAAKTYSLATANAKVVNSLTGDETAVAPAVAAVSTALAGKLSTAGGTMTGTLTAPETRVVKSGSNVYSIVQGDAGMYRGLLLQTGAAARWVVASDSTVESGSNEGSDLRIRAYNDAGGLIGDRMLIDRSTGATTIYGTALNVQGTGARVNVSAATGDSYYTLSGAPGSGRFFVIQP
jgi:hypothetical protein